MILESVEHGLLIWPTIKENEVTRPRKYSELTPVEAIQADCDVKATNIILQGLPPEVNALERECKLYDEFDNFAYKKLEILRDFSLRFSLLLNDMNIYNVKLEQFQVNTKFLNNLPPEWSKFVIDVKLKGDDPIDAINHMMSFLSAVVTSHYPTTNNQAMPSSELSSVLNHSETEIASDSNIIPYSQYVHKTQHAAVQHSNSSTQQDALILYVIEQLKTQLINCTKINLVNKSVNDTLTAELERYKEQVKVLKEGQNVDLKSQDNVLDSCEQSFKIDRLSEQLKEKESLMQTVTLLKNNFKKEESRNIDREIALE
nr:hypothetical protein [Tanacetum cinerariifolium]